MSDVLKRCPFCGGPPRVNMRTLNQSVFIGCERCAISYRAATYELAVQFWNHRPAEDELAQLERETYGEWKGLVDAANAEIARLGQELVAAREAAATFETSLEEERRWRYGVEDRISELEKHSAKLGLIHSAIEFRLRQHRENLAKWEDGTLAPTEPDPEEREEVMEQLRIAIDELERTLNEAGEVLSD